MVALQKFRNRRVAIYGMGKTGCSAAKVLKKLNANVLCWDDSKKIRKKAKNLKFLITLIKTLYIKMNLMESEQLN